jgi:hypothetical protein
MNRSEFLRSTSQLACASCATLVFGGSSSAAAATATATAVDEALKRAQDENRFINHWLTDLFDAIEGELDRPTQLKLLEGCGRGCFRRHKFKTDIAEAGRGDVDKLVEAYRTNFNISRDGDRVHIQYGGGCYCPAARHRPPRPNDLHCECTRSTHEAIFSTALGRPIRAELI